MPVIFHHHAEQIRQVFQQVKQEFGKIDILINNAATLDNVAQIQNMSYELWDRDIKVNLTGAFNCTKEVWPYMQEQKWGRVIFMASVAGTMGGFGQASYSASKAAVVGLAKTCALEGGRYNITANAIVPGIIGTEAFKMGNPEMNERIGKAMMAGPAQWTSVKRLRRDPHDPDASCWLHGRSCCFSTV